MPVVDTAIVVLGIKSLPPWLMGRRLNLELVFRFFLGDVRNKTRLLRAVQGARCGWLFNLWSEGQRVFRNEPQSGGKFRTLGRAVVDRPQLETWVWRFRI